MLSGKNIYNMKFSSSTDYNYTKVCLQVDKNLKKKKSEKGCAWAMDL